MSGLTAIKAFLTFSSVRELGLANCRLYLPISQQSEIPTDENYESKSIVVLKLAGAQVCYLFFNLFLFLFCISSIFILYRWFYIHLLIFFDANTGNFNGSYSIAWTSVAPIFSWIYEFKRIGFIGASIVWIRQHQLYATYN